MTSNFLYMYTTLYLVSVGASMIQGTSDRILDKTGKPHDHSNRSDRAATNNPLGLYSLIDACKKFFPGLDIDARDLKREARRGRLKLTRIGRRECVSEAAIREMLNSCQESQSHQGSCSKPEVDASHSGSSLTMDVRSAQVAAETTLKELAARLKPTSQPAEKSGRKTTPKSYSSRIS